MQTYVLNLTNGGRMYSAQADLFVYESGVNSNDAEEGENRIIIKPDNGNEMTLRPGQRFRLPPGEKAAQWLVRAVDDKAPIVGAIIIGSGEFDDANTMNKVKLDASFANVVRVSNTADDRVPVNLDLTKRIPVALDPQAFINLANPIMSYSEQVNFSASVTTPAVILTAADNVKGVIVEQTYTVQSGGTVQLQTNNPVTGKTELVDVVKFSEGVVRRRTLLPAGYGIKAVATDGYPATGYIALTKL